MSPRPAKGKRGAAGTQRPSKAVRRVEITAPIDRREAEALRLAILRLAERHRVAIGEVRIERGARRSRKARP